MKTWYKKELVRNLVDMHIPNGDGFMEKFDPKKYAENIKKSGATVAYIYGSNCLGLCFFPTKTGIRHQAAERDIFGETVKECRKLGLGVVGYLNSWGSFVSDEHPDWNVVDESERIMRHTERFGNPCLNNPEYADYFTSIVREFVSSYDLDGLWIDMVGIWAPVCHCDSCKKKFFEEYGLPLPTGNYMQSPEYVDYIRFKGKSVADYARRIRETALAERPELSVSIQAAGGVKYPRFIGVYDLDYFKTSDYLAGDFYTDRSGVNAISRILYKLSENLPFEFMTSRCSGLEFHTMNKDLNEIICQAYAAIMYKGAFLFIDAIDPDGEMNSRFYEDISVVSKNLKPYEQYIDYTEKPIREIAVYFNFDSFADGTGRVMPSDKPSARYMIQRLQRISAALSEAGLDYDILTPKSLGELSDYKVIILSSMETVSDTEAEAIQAFVKNGGRLYISGLTSIRDDKGTMRDNFMLSDVMGVSYEGRTEITPNYIAPSVDDKSIFGSHTAKYPHMLNERLVITKPCGKGKKLATITLPISDASDHRLFSSAISNPPITPTDIPAIYENSFGEGRVIYSAGVIEHDRHPDNVNLFTSIVKYLRGEGRVTLRAPSCVDYTVYESENALKINLLNSQTILPPIKIGSLGMDIGLNGRKVKSVKDVTGGETSYTVSDGALHLTTDLDVYKLIIAELE